MSLLDHALDLDNGGIIMKTRILDRSFKYVPSHQTNIRRTFARARRELSQQQAKADHTRQRIEVATVRSE